mmetsp:Transcript_3170/g.3875  ORF Transcript_3170/g.3875 Transcript_3170/m.3875 type:complete len:197 (-) Transcript_3170:19-609(-)
MAVSGLVHGMAALRHRRSVSILVAMVLTVEVSTRALTFMWTSTRSSDSTSTAIQRRDLLQQTLPLASALGAGTALFAEERAAVAVQSKWNGRYNDPKHPRCERSIFVSYDGKKVKIAGYDPETGVKCLSGGVQEYRWSLQAELAGVDSDSITVESARRSVTTRTERPDGSKWEPVVAKWDGDGILFPDGTKWTKKD